MNETSNDCLLCAVAGSNSLPTPFEELLPGLDRRDQILINGDDLAFSMIDVAPIAHGHCLIVPAAHRVSIAQCTPAELRAVSNMMKGLGDAIEAVWGRTPMFFEHGQCAESSDKGCSISHAHLHVISTPDEIESAEVAGRDMQPVADLQDLGRFVGPEGYVFTQLGFEGGLAAMAHGTVSQLLRRHFCRPSYSAGRELWNYSDQLLFASELDTAQRVRANLTLLRDELDRVIEKR